MAPQAIIDLLSTDDELPAHPRVLKTKTAAKESPASLFLSDPLHSEDVASNDWGESVPKRRKLSKSPPPEISKHSSTSKILALSKTKHNRSISELSDDIIFTSSAGIPRTSFRPLGGQSNNPLTEESEDDLPDDIFSIGKENLAPQFSDKTASFLAKVKGKQASVPRKSATAGKATVKRKAARISSLSPRSTQYNYDSDGNTQSRAKPAKNSKLTDEEKALRAQEKETLKETRAIQKAKDKEVEKENRRLEREEKAREKQRAADLAEVNKAKKDRKETCKEMFVDLPLSIEGSRVDDQIREFLKNQQITTTSYQSPIPHIIRWRRKIDSCFDEEQGHRVAIPKEIRDEKHALCLMSAKEFVDLATANASHVENDTLDGHIHKVKTRYTGYSIIYIVEGLDPWLRKNKNARNRAYQAAVLGQTESTDGTAPASSQQTSRRKKQPEVPIDEDMIEDALLRLQVIEHCLVHHTATSFESAEWVANFTQHISQIPYK